MRWRFLIFLLLMLGLNNSRHHLLAQAKFEITPQVEGLIRKGMADMYSYNLQPAGERFDQLIRLFPEHPAGYMYRAQIEWWKALRDFTNKNYASSFDIYINAAIQKGEALIEKDPRDFYAFLFLASAYGCRTRFAVTVSGQTLSAIRSGKAGNKYIHAAMELRPDYVDCLLGTGAWDYFTGDLPSIIKPLVILLGIRGDKTRGKEALLTVSQKGEFAQIEARIVLLGVAINEKQFQEWLGQLEDLIMQYPTNPVFYNWMGSYFSKEKKWDEGIRQFSELQKKLTARDGKIGTSSETAFLHFNLGNLELGRKNLDPAIVNLSAAISLRPDDYLLVAPATLLRGSCYELKHEQERAVADYRAVLRLPSVDKSHREAARGLRAFNVKE
jgi:tetratricopeptide (TPR) repeat protein